jgi:hypothetical protein
MPIKIAPAKLEAAYAQEYPDTDNVRFVPDRLFREGKKARSQMLDGACDGPA